MYIEEVIIDGFKSYATRTVISGFDKQFNAITGLNGSGKSNILDAICFVLGISNLSQVRVGNLQELVYKQGQAGVTKASVTIVFNNEDRTASPVGYDQYDKITVTRQVVIGGRNKYLINGHNAQLNRVQNLFHSVQLNVNNPHFLIMQGKITKVLNMKPPEILSMIEEAAGTRMFETKKQSTLKTIEKKQKKVEEINRILTEDITPTLENLRKERTEYMQWAQNQQECERLKRFCVAYEFSQAEETLQHSVDDVKKMEEKCQQYSTKNKEYNEEVKKIKDKISKLTQQKEREMGEEIDKFEHSVNKLSNSFVKATSNWQHKKENLEAEINQRDNLQQSLQEESKNIEKKQKQLEKMKNSNASLEKETHELQEKLKELEKMYQAQQAGAVEDDGQATSFADHLINAKNNVITLATEIKQAEMRIPHLTNQLKKDKKNMKQNQTEYKKLEDEYSVAQNELQSAQKKLDKAGFNPEEETNLLTKKNEVETKVFQLREKVNNLKSQLSRLEFRYADPEPGFDKRKVKGLVASLVKVKDPQTTTTALEVTAGGRLWNVVVDSEQTGKLLLSRGKLRQRVTIIPLNKINGRAITPQVLNTAEKLVGKENVKVAQDLVDYNQEVEAAMKYIFGNTFIAKDMNTAKTITFNQNIKTRSVTLQGDVFDPAGTLTGGSAPQSGSILAKVAELHAAKLELKEYEDQLNVIIQNLLNMKNQSENFQNLNKQFKLASHQVELVQQRMNENVQHKFITTIQEMEKELSETEDSFNDLKNRKIEAEEKVKRLQSEAGNFKDKREEQMRGTEVSISDTKQKLQTSSKALKKEQTKIDKLQLETQQLIDENKSLEEQIKKADQTIESLEDEVSQLEEIVVKKKEKHEEAKEVLEKKREHVLKQTKAIVTLMSERDEATQKITDGDLQIKKLEGKISRFHKDQSDAQKLVKHMIEKYSWIRSEKQYFGQSGTDYDFSSQNPQTTAKKLAQLQETQDGLSKSLNKKVMNMLEKAEQEYTELKEKKQIIENDKKKIEAVIEELEEKKNEALNTTWEKVNTDFGSIFSTLLPGSVAKLQPPEGKTVLDGLEFRVAFGDVWKENLSELSGGQRSLLALSLILALLLFKPAPMYILDEIDAALDLNHTQNIGQMLKAHFSTSQFIIVSLKEGMFKNANVLFKTKFVDGISTIHRSVLKQ